MLKDTRFALRSLLAAPSFTLMAVATLAVAIGGTTAISSFVRGILLAPLSYRDEEEARFELAHKPGAGVHRTPGLREFASARSGDRPRIAW